MTPLDVYNLTRRFLAGELVAGDDHDQGVHVDGGGDGLGDFGDGDDAAGESFSPPASQRTSTREFCLGREQCCDVVQDYFGAAGPPDDGDEEITLD